MESSERLLHQQSQILLRADCTCALGKLTQIWQVRGNQDITGYKAHFEASVHESASSGLNITSKLTKQV